MTVCTYAACPRPAGTVVDGWAMCNRHARGQHTESTDRHRPAQTPAEPDPQPIARISGQLLPSRSLAALRAVLDRPLQGVA